MKFSLWLDALIRPEETFKRERHNASLGDAMLNVGAAGLISGIMLGLLVFLLTAIIPSAGKDVILGFGILGFIVVVVGYPILSVFGLLMGSSIIFIVAKIFGGKGDFTTQTYLFSLFMAPISIIQILGFIPLIGILVSLIVGLYSLYLYVVALREVHSFSTGRAILTILIPAVLAIIAVILFTVALVYLLFS